MSRLELALNLHFYLVWDILTALSSGKAAKGKSKPRSDLEGLWKS